MFRAIRWAAAFLVALFLSPGVAIAVTYSPVPTCQTGIGGVDCSVDNGGDTWTSYYCNAQHLPNQCYGPAAWWDTYGWTALANGAPPHNGILMGVWDQGSLAVAPTKFYYQADACSATQNQPITGTVSRTGEPSASNPPPQEVCHQSCLYGLSSAVAATGIDGTELWSGTWIGTGEACPGTSPPPSPGTGEDGETNESASADNATREATTAEAAQLAAIDQLKADSIASRSGGETASPIGNFFALPSWVLGLFTRQNTDCMLKIQLQGTASASFADKAYTADVCEMQDIADSYGNWFVWFCAVVWCWAIVVGARGDD